MQHPIIARNYKLKTLFHTINNSYRSLCSFKIEFRTHLIAFIMRRLSKHSGQISACFFIHGNTANVMAGIAAGLYVIVTNIQHSPARRLNVIMALFNKI